MSVSEIRELTTAELNEVAGGLPVAPFIFGMEAVALLIGVSLFTEDPVTSSIPVGDSGYQER